MLRAYSKVNLGLDIDNNEYSFTNKHKLSSLFVLYKKLFDEIEIKSIEDNQDTITYLNCDDIDPQSCLVRKTLDYLRSQNLISEHYEITITKNIPTQSGLGGGSSDAAVVIKALVPNYQQLDLQAIALELGSDIPFFLSGYEAAIIGSFGDEVVKVELPNNLNLQVHLTPYKFSTSKVFKDYFLSRKEVTKKNDFNKIINDLKQNKVSNIVNNFFDVVKTYYPEWLSLYYDLQTKHDCVVMSGSGGSIVSIDLNKKIRTRYAPSPTGYFHIGGARTAIFNYLYARHNHGDFIVRIEDTDTTRSVENGIESQLDNLEWLNVDIDESIKNPIPKYGPYMQTQKIGRYQELANKLLQEGKAYYCFCDEEQLELDREVALKNHQTPKYSRRCLQYSQAEIDELLKSDKPRAIRLKIDENKNYEWEDTIRGTISVPGSAMTDPVILKSNGIAMYNFAVVVDDYDMEITHVLRGEEHISNTPYQLAVAEALNLPMSIKYGHLSVIIDESGKKLSKRNKEMKQFIEDYKVMGFIPQAVFNFLGLLSWSSPNNQEILTKEEFIELFDIKSLSKSPSFFDFKKMLWLGNEYFKKMTNDEYLVFVKPFIKVDLPVLLQNSLDDLLLLFKNQISYADQLNDLIKEYFLEDHKLDLDAETLALVKANTDVIETFKVKINELIDWNYDSISNIINEVKSITGKKGKDLFMPIRVAATGLTHGPELAKVLYFTQQKTILANIDKILKYV